MSTSVQVGRVEWSVGEALVLDFVTASLTHPNFKVFETSKLFLEPHC